MSNRHLARSVVLQTLFQVDFSNVNVQEADAILGATIAEYAPSIGERDFMKTLMHGVIDRRVDLDTIIQKAAPEWPIDKISLVDRSVLRLGLYELLFGDRAHVPAKVAINEAIELAKTFGGDSSGRFVNGVLGSVYKEMGEPGKDEQSKKKKDVPYEELPLEMLGGAVVYAKHENDIYLAFVHDVFGHWTLSKGKIEKNEDVKVGTAREIQEELGLDVVIQDELGSNEYVASHPEKGKVRKRVEYFLAEAPFHEITLGTSGGLDDGRWFRVSEILNLNIYDDILPLITKAITLLSQK
ncbi:transcription antitermination factor NusB [Candidatus Campbellbacteria bacterium]|nr:MAG: transcription antitermination factor NusB [Candidatus Campbellbacteria bacterium]